MKRIIVSTLSAFALLITMWGTASAQEAIPVCIQGFEGTPGVEYYTEAQIAEIEAVVDGPGDIPSPKVTGYPDPATGSGATENGELMEYDSEFFTPICVLSGPEGDGPRVVQFAINHYLTEESEVIYAAPVTGSCDDDSSESVPDQNGTDADAQDGSTTELPNTGVGAISAGDGDGALVSFLGVVSVSALLFASGVRASRR